MQYCIFKVYNLCLVIRVYIKVAANWHIETHTNNNVELKKRCSVRLQLIPRELVTW